jgi:Lrp/AsnC family transcriptional regulator, leucine-responsive regulatory protein
MEKFSAIQLDARDLAVLTELLRDARISHTELADRVGLSPSACARRMSALSDAGIITGHQAVIDLARLGLSTTVSIRITLSQQSEDALDAFEHAIAQCASVTSCFLMTGSDDYLVTIVVRDIEDFEEIHRHQLSRLPGVARIQSSFAIRKIVQRAVPPSALLK